MQRISVIDADSMVWIIGWAVKENKKDDFGIQEVVQVKCDSLLKSILSTTNSTGYIGVFSEGKSSRYTDYKMAPYKGKRPDKPEWMVEWESFIIDFLKESYGFYSIPNYEADDIVAMIAKFPKEETEVVVCSPDKDMKQIPGLHYDYKNSNFTEVDVVNATLMSKFLILCGDSADNILGIPGTGEVKAKKLLQECTHETEVLCPCVQTAYQKHFGPYYGEVILKETYNAVNFIDYEDKNSLWKIQTLNKNDLETDLFY